MNYNNIILFYINHIVCLLIDLYSLKNLFIFFGGYTKIYCRS